MNGLQHQVAMPAATTARSDAFAAQPSKTSVSPPRGRRLSREGDKDDDSENGDHPPRKRRRSRKTGDKKFECPHEGCGKQYSRAEHLYRHQLNRKCAVSTRLQLIQ
jgi:uncharacterized Zn-finger protein